MSYNEIECYFNQTHCIYSVFNELPSPDDCSIPSSTPLFHEGEMGDLGEEEDPGDGKVMLLPTDEEKLFLLEPLLRLSSLGVLSTERLTNGPSVLK